MQADEAESVPNNIAILDPGSRLVAFLRMDNAYLGSVDISIKKAETVAYFNGLFPSYALLNRSEPGGKRPMRTRSSLRYPLTLGT